MAQKFDIGLNAKINEFSKKFGITRTDYNDADTFEDFGNYIIASILLEEELNNTKSVSTNKAQGIDGIIIIVNNKLISEETDLNKIGETEPIKVKLSFVQSTTERSFDEQKFSAFTDTVVNFLSGSISIEPYSTILNKILDENGCYIDRFEETPHISLHFISARTNHEILQEKINIERNKLISRNDIENKFVLDKISVYQKDEINSEYDNIKKFHSVQLKFDTNVQLSDIEDVELSLLTTIKFSELKKLILTTDGSLKEKLFLENVRNYIGNTSVNIDIKRTLDDEVNKKYFPYLNNGLTIICDKIDRHHVKRDVFTLTFPRIINGCQTTNMLFQKWKENNESIENVEVVAKIISTNNDELKKKIIHTANNQNSIDKDLQSLNDFHIKIETYFLGKEQSCFNLYFERLRGQYAQIIPPYSRIDIESLAKVYLSIFRKEPHLMKSHALAIIDKYQKEEKVFHNPDNISDYYYSAILWYWYNHFLIGNIIKPKSKTMDMHLLLVCDLLLNENCSNIEDKITKLSLENNAKELFENATNILNSKNYLFERRGFYSAPKTNKLIGELTNATN